MPQKKIDIVFIITVNRYTPSHTPSGMITLLCFTNPSTAVSKKHTMRTNQNTIN